MSVNRFMPPPTYPPGGEIGSPVFIPGGQVSVRTSRPEVRNRLEVRRKPTRQPDQFHVTLAFQAAARLKTVQIPLDVVIGGPTRADNKNSSDGSIGHEALKSP